MLVDVKCFSQHILEKKFGSLKKKLGFSAEMGGGGGGGEAPLEMRAASLPAIFRGEHILAQKPLFSEEPRHQTPEEPHFRPKLTTKLCLTR